MIPRHVRHPKRDFGGAVAAFVCVFFLAGVIGIGWAIIERLLHG